MTEEPLQNEQEELEVEEQQQQPAEDDRLLRLAAEFDNYKKRAAREREQYVVLANERLVKELLPVLDDLERALAAAESHSARYGAGGADASADDRLRQAYADEAQLEDGVRLVHRSLAQLLERNGVIVIETDGKFDPHVHEALLTQPAEDKESGIVLDVIQKGYRLGDRVVRPARVIVSE
jgi:molecular chaperone GrpE